MRCSRALHLPPLPPAGFRSCCTAHEMQPGTPPPLLASGWEPGVASGELWFPQPAGALHQRSTTVSEQVPPRPPPLYCLPLGSGPASPAIRYHPIRDGSIICECTSERAQPLPPPLYCPPLGSKAAGPASQCHHIRSIMRECTSEPPRAPASRVSTTAPRPLPPCPSLGSGTT